MSLNAHRVHLLRTSGFRDTYFARIWRVTPQTIRRARTGETWRDHPTPPDTRWRGFKCGGRPKHKQSDSTGGLRA